MSRQSAREAPHVHSLAIGLGWFSVGLGVAEVIAPRAMARLVGVTEGPRTVGLVRSMGAREVGHGIAILTRPDSAARVWARVAGDSVDLALLGSALNSTSHKRRTALATAAVLSVTVVDILCARRVGDPHSDPSPRDRGESRAVAAITVNRPIEQVFAFWRSLDNVKQFMRHLNAVEVPGDEGSGSHAMGPAGAVEWQAEIVDEREDEIIRWQSLPGLDVDNRRYGQVPAGAGRAGHGGPCRNRSTTRRTGALGRTIARLLAQDPTQQLNEDLRRFKQLIETGEVARSDGPALWRAAQPPTGPEQKRSTRGKPS